MLPQLKRQDADDFLYYSQGLLSESSRSDIFMVKNQSLRTLHTGLLPSITRKHVLAVCPGMFAVEERAIPLADVFEKDVVFITSSNQRMMPVRQVDHWCSPTGPGTR